MNQSTETFLRIEAIFNEALEIAPEARPALVAERCGDDANLLSEIQSLLRASDAEEHLTASRRGKVEIVGEPLPERRRVGPYEIDRLVGRGGMGAVYLAHRADGQFDQQVAIKLIDLPLATDFFRERFRQERQILAGLQHPYIARLLDGGVTAEGDLYLAMEYVDGTPIHRYCNAHRISVSQRLSLFVKVCEAVQFAHQNLVVHRDLKPDNILVAEDGTPRLLDFGTAKLTSPNLEMQEGDLTRQGFQSYTPQYASPEQVIGNPITTASDTYSLGVLLYLLLSGSLPYEIKELNTAELMRVICNEPPRRPTTSPDSNERLDPDLEAILQKALRKEPLERYRTAEQLAADIQDFLAGRPVDARKGSFRYRASKFIGRNRLAIAAASILALTLAAGVAGILWQSRVANEQRRKAEARSADLRQLSNSLLSELDDAIKQLPGSTGVQKLLVTRVLEHLDRMAQDSQGDRLTQLDLVDAYSHLAGLQGDPYDQNLGDPAGALVSIGKALAIIEPLSNADSEDRQAMQALAGAEATRSEILFGTGKTAEAVASMRAAVHAYDHLIAAKDTPVALIGETAATYGALGDELGQPGTASLGDIPAALVSYRKTIELDQRALRIDPDFLRAKRGLAIMQMKIGSAELDDDPGQAFKDFQLAINQMDLLPEAEKSTLSLTRLRYLILRKQANALEELGRYPEALAIFATIIPYNQKIVDQDPLDIRALADLEVVLDDEAGLYDDAAGVDLTEPSSNPAITRHKNQVAAMHLYLQTAMLFERMLKLTPSNENWKAGLAYAQMKAGAMGMELHDPGDPAALSRKGVNALRELALNPEASPMVLDFATHAALDAEPVELRDPAFGLKCAERVAALSHRRTASILLLLAQAYKATGQMQKARDVIHEALALMPANRSGEPKSRIRRELEYELRGIS
jgi:serine/threonine protein kinase